jgi:hypothetical protein
MVERWRRGPILLALLSPVQAASAPAWARELDARLVERGFELDSSGESGVRGRAGSLLDDGALDLRFEWSDESGGFELVLLQPGVILPADAAWPSASGVASLDAARRALRALPPAAQRALALVSPSPSEPPPLSRGRWPLREATLVRTTRPGAPGGGALALVVPGARAFVLALPAEAALPRRAEGWYEQEAGRSSGTFELFAAADPAQPWCSTFDVVRLDRDHVEWSGVAPRDLECDAAGTLRAVAGGGARFDSPEVVVARALGFERRLRVERVPRPQLEPPFAFRFENLAADRVAPAAASGRDVVLLDELGEPVAGAWLFARTGRPPPAGLAPSLFVATSDLDGKARLPLANGVDAAQVELVAFEAGARARFGRRRGADSGSGGECALLLDRMETCSVAVEPAPGFATWVGLRLLAGDSGDAGVEAAFLVRLSKEGSAALPAFGGAAELELGPPYVRRVERLELSPGRAHAIAGRLAAGLERRIRPTLGGSDLGVAELAVRDVEPAGAVIVEAKSLLVPPEFAGAPVRFTISARGLSPKPVELAADAPRDQDLPMERR